MSARDKIGLGYGTQLNEMSNNSETNSEISLSVFYVRSSDEESTPANDRSSKVDGYHDVPPPITGNFLTPKADISFAGKTNEANTQKPKTIYEPVNRDKVIIEDWNSDDEDDVSEVQTVSPVKTNEIQTVRTRVDKIDQTSQKQGISFKKIKACFVCKSTDHLIKDCNFHDKKSQEPKFKNIVNTSPRVNKLVWDNAKRVNHQKISNKLKYPHLRKTFVLTGVLTRTDLITHVKQNEKRVVHKVSTASLVSTAKPVSTARPVSIARPVSTVRPFAPKIAQTSGVIRPIYPRMDNVRPRGSYSPLKRVVVNTGKGKMDTDLKKSRWVWRPKGNYLDHVSKDSGSFMLKKGNPEILLHDHAVVDSGCSSHMTSNKAYLSDYEDFNRGFVAFGSDPKGGKITGKGKIKTANLDFDDVYFVDELKFNLFSISQMCDKKNSILFTESECLILSPSFKLLDESQVVLRAPRKDDVYSLDLKNIVPSGGITCLYANATADESKLWHRRLGHVNFKNINKLVKGHLVRGLPSKVFVNDHTCVACKKGKQHKASCSIKEKIKELLRNTYYFYYSYDQDTIEDVALAAHEKPFEKVIAKALDDATRQAFELSTDSPSVSTDRPFVSTDRSFVSTDRSNTPNVSAASTPTGANAGESSFVYLGGKIPIDASTLPNADLPIDPNMPDLEDASDTLPNDGIFNGAYDDDEDVGAVADFNNMDNTIAVSPIPTLRIHKDHPKGQILGDPTSAVQTRGKIQKASSAQQALVSYIHKQNRTNHKDHQNCLFACFLSQEEPKTISQALQDESWVEAMQEELLQFKLQKVWVLVDLPYGKKVIGTKWVFRNKRDERSIVVKNKARLVAQGFRQEEGIDYDEVFAPVARIEAIRLFLAFASYMGFTVYQMDVKSAFLYSTIKEEVYVYQPPGFIDPTHPNKVYKVIKALYGLHQAPRAWYETLSSFLMENGFRRGTIDKTLFIKKKKSDIMLVQVYVDDINFGSTKQSMCTEFEECMHKRFQMSSMGELTFFLGLQVKQLPEGIFISQDKSMIGSLMYLTASRPDIILLFVPVLDFKLISWQCKKQTIVANSTTKAEYVAAANFCGQVLWIQSHMMDYGFNFMNTKIHIDNESTISVIKNHVAHSRTKHIEIRFHFIRDFYEKRLIEVIKIHIDSNVAELLTKGFDVIRFNFLVVSIGMLNL
ncbi:putative ribonuclease H-like domain-containing protein [Tanacetum coccineum]